jgi:parallel beta-helix repeat protein
MRLRSLVALSSIVCLCTPAPAFAATLVVDNDFADCPPADFSSIQAAVTAAQPGDKILVCRGVYLETVLVEKSDLRIEAQAAPGEVVLQGTPPQLVGFHLLNSSGVVLQGFTVQSFLMANIRIEGGSGNTLRNNIATALIGPASSSINVLNSSANLVEQNTSYANCSTCNGIGVLGAGSSDNIVRHNETFLNGSAGVHVNGSGPRNVLHGNRSHSNSIGIRNVVGSHGNVIENNHLFANAPVTPAAVSGGIILGLSTGVTVRNNRSERNAIFGIRLQNGASQSLIEKNEVLENGQDGIRLEPTVTAGSTPVLENIVRFNHVRRNGRDGIRVFNELAAGNTLERNVIRESGEHDAHDDSVGPGTAGTANFWIENKCETENRPELCKNPF